MVSRLLAHYWTAADREESRQAQIEDWLDDLREFGPAIVAEACRRWRRQPGGRRPTPGDIRALCIEERRDHGPVLAITDGRETWPKWLEELWGPVPEGPRRRAESLRRANTALRLPAARVAGFATPAAAIKSLEPFRLLDADDPAVLKMLGEKADV